MSALDKFVKLGFSVGTSDEKIIDCRESIRALIADRDALAAQVEGLKSACQLAIDMFKVNDINVPNTIETLEDAIDAEPQQHLAEIRAEAVEGFFAHFESESYWDKTINDVIDEGYEYAAKVRQGNQGTWLKDSNVNGGKRQGGE